MEKSSQSVALGFTYFHSLPFFGNLSYQKHKDGTEDVRMNTKWTQKGRRFLYEKLKSVGVIPVIERT